MLRFQLLWQATICALLALGAVSPQARIPTSLYEQITAALREGKAAEAENSLRRALERYPRDARGLGLMGAILDAQKRFEEAERCYRQALRIAPRSASVLNNLGNHYLARGDRQRARTAFRKVVAIEPRHPNANLQLAQMSVAAQGGAAAIRYLNRLPADDQSAPAVRLLRAQALHLMGQTAAATGVLSDLEREAERSASVAFSIGMTFARWKRYEDAERAFTRALESAPANPDILYNLGLAAMRAGHLDRAKEVLEIGLGQRPDDVDFLEGLARVYAERKQQDQAVVLLVKAEKLAPNRPDILMFLAHMTEELGFFGDTAIAYDKYLKLKPHDDVARRERGFALARSAKIDAGLEDLRWYVAKYPNDPRGLYELAVAETVRDPEKAFVSMDQAVRLDPSFHAARYARAVMHYQAGRTEQAIADSREVLKHQPDDYRALDVLGQALLQKGQVEEATVALRRAAALAPEDPKVLMHYSRALIRTGRREEAKAVLDQFKRLGPEEGRRRPYGGLFEFLNLPPAEQRAQYMTNLQRTITTRPNDPTLKVRLGKALLGENRIDEAMQVFREIPLLTQDPSILADSGRTLLDYGLYEGAREFLERVVSIQAEAADLRLDYVISVFHTAGAEAGLAELEKIPQEQHNGDYLLLRAQILDAMGKYDEAVATLNQAFQAAPTRLDLHFQAALFLIKNQQYQQAVDLLEHANQLFPGIPELMLTQAITLELLQRVEEATRILKQLQSRWPEWSEPYLVHGIMLETRVRSAEAKSLLETAIALGARDPAAYYYLALAIMHATPDDVEGAAQAIAEAAKLDPENPYVRALAGRVAYSKKDYASALEHLSAAIRIWPEMVEARQTLSATYRALGEKEKSVAELKEIVRIKQANPTADQTPPLPVRSLLFSVRPPARPPS